MELPFHLMYLGDSKMNITTSRTTPYNTRGNGQFERFNGTIWNYVVTACKSRNNDKR